MDKCKVQKKNNYDLGVRVNSVESGLCEDDLIEVLSSRNLPDTILLPKVDTIEHLEWVNINDP